MTKLQTEIKKHLWKIISLGILSLLGVAVIAGYFAYDNLQDQLTESVSENRQSQRALERSLDDAQQQAEEAGDAVELVLEKNESLEKDLDEVKESAQTQISELEEKIVEISLSTDSSELVSQWQGRVGLVYCSNSYGDWSGSGTAFLDYEDDVFVLTNHHVINGADYCYVGFPEDDYYYYISPESMYFDSYLDWAIMYIWDPSQQLLSSIFAETACSYSDMEIGEDVVILGFPGSGASSSITVTEGIISGFDPDHVVTDAKIDHGNSGGAAIHVGSNCFVGIPTSAVVGSIESYGRILNINSILSSMSY